MTASGRRLRLAALAACLLGVSLLSPAADAAGPCRAIGDRGPQGGRPTSAPPPAPVLFPSDFRPPTDCEWGFPVGGWGGVRRGAPLKHDPVIFVHGNHSDAVDWFGVADQFKAAGYNDQELWAISYNGLGGQVDGAPIICPCPPSPRALAYMSRADVAPLVLQGGQYAANDVNVPDLYAFVKAVLAYTGAGHVQLVGHSLGTTVIRKMLFDHRELFRRVSAAVSIAGGSHGTSLCRDMETTLYSCDEVAPDSPWLKQLNSIGEAPGPTKWMSLYNGTNNLDPFFLKTATYDDTWRPHMQGAVNLTYPDAYHSDLRVRPDIIATYLAFLAKHSQQGRR
jgi:pimeloyl-ACP methyl ester carboxylesterase